MDYYTRLEQGRGAALPSVAVLESIARALDLPPAERNHLHRLAGSAAPAPATPEQPAPALLFLLERLPSTPAQIVSDLGEVLAQNSPADQVFPWVLEQDTANVYEYWFDNAGVRAVFPDDQRAEYSVAQAGELRTAATRRALSGDLRGEALVAELLQRSAEFERAWSAVRAHDGRDKSLWIAEGPSIRVFRAHVTVDASSSQMFAAFEERREINDRS